MSVTLDWSNEQEAVPVREEWIELLEWLLRLAAEAEGLDAGEVTLTLVDDDEIRRLNREFRGIDKATDVLSFPLEEPGERGAEIVFGADIEEADEDDSDGRLPNDDCPDDGDSGERRPGDEGPEDDGPHDGSDGIAGGWGEYPILLGDIVISVPRAVEQAQVYGHSVERELGFLFVHGFLHLLGYDHNTEEREREMFAKQEAVLARVGLTR